MAELKDEMSKGKISAEMVADAFKGATSEGGLFYGSMDKQSKTFAGQMSTLSDNVKSTLGQVMMPMFNNLSQNILPKVNDAVGVFSDTFKKTGDVGLAFNATISKILPPDIVSGILSLEKGISSVFNFIINNGNTIKGVIAGLTGAFVAYKLAVLASNATMEISNLLMIASALKSGGLALATSVLAEAEGGATLAQTLLNLAMSLNPIGIVVIAIGALVGAIVYLWNTNEGFRKAVILMWNVLKNEVVTKATEIKDGIVKGFEEAKAYILSLPSQAKKWGTDFIEGFIGGIKSRKAGLKSAMSDIASVISSVIHFSRPDEGPLRDYETWMPDFIEGMTKGLDNNKYKLSDSIKNIASDMKVNINGTLSNVGKNNNSNNAPSNNSPLFVIENFNNNTDKDIETLMYEMEFYRKKASAALGGN